MAPDPALSASLKLEGEWSALHYASELTASTVTDLTARLERMEPMTRVRLLLAALLLPRAKREELRDELEVSCKTCTACKSMLDAAAAIELTRSALS